MSYTPPDGHNVILNFEQPFTPVDSHNVVLNFGDSAPQLNVLSAPLKTGFKAVISGTNTATAINNGTLQANVKTQLKVVITGSNYELVDNRGTLNAMLNTAVQAISNGINNINHIVGVNCSLGVRFKKAITALSVTEISWSKPILRVGNTALFFDQGLVISQQVGLNFDNADTLTRSVRLLHEQATGLSQCVSLRFEKAETHVVAQTYVHDVAVRMTHNRETKWQEMIRLRKNVTYSYDVADVLQKRFTFEWDKGLELLTFDRFPWDEADSIHYVKHKIEPWPKPVKPKYEGSADLNFVCLCHDVDAHNVVLNFGQDDCLPTIPNRNGCYIVNNVEVTRLDNGEKIKVISGSYKKSRDAWCISHSLVVPVSEIAKLGVVKGIVLKLVVNGSEHHIMLEESTESIRFAEHTYNLDGRSLTALNSSDYMPKRSFLQENERTSVQLCQAELDRVFSETVLNWQLLDEVGWIVPTESLSYTNLAPIDAIKLVVEAGGGMLQSAKTGNELIVAQRYKKSYWDPMTIADYDRLLPESLVTEHNIQRIELPEYNAITLINPNTALSATVKRSGTGGDVVMEAVSNPLFEAVAMGGYGKAALSQSGLTEKHSFKTVICDDFGECDAGETLAYNAEFWGIVDEVSISYTYAKVEQTVVVEVHREST